MPATPFNSRYVNRPWGREQLPPGFPGVAMPERIGELWFAADDCSTELLVKYLFTSERLSIQVHPDDAAAHSSGLPRGKSEAWFVLDAEPGAVIGLGLVAPLSPDALRAAAGNGAIEQMIDWRPVRAGEFIYSPAGTIHAIGAGLSLIEIQQNLDMTYRLYDYGRPRELHLDEALAVADRSPFAPAFTPYHHGAGRQILIEDAAFVVERWRFSGNGNIRSADDQVQLIPLRTGGLIDGQSLDAGTVWRVEQDAMLEAGDNLDLLVAYPGRRVRGDLYRPGEP